MTTSKRLPFRKVIFRAFTFSITIAAVAMSRPAFSSPGAHGPNGEHIDTKSVAHRSVIPKFEAFTEAFEILGEVSKQHIHVYLHDFSSNAPVTDASIELESDGLKAIAEFSNEHQSYRVLDEAFINRITVQGNHEIIATVIAPSSGDLLVANLTMPENSDDGEVEEDHHHHFPWWVIGVLGALFVGYWAGKKHQGARA